MRKIKPQDVKNQFSRFADERLTHFFRLETLLDSTPHEKRDLSILSEVTLHSIYVAFEVLLSDLIVAYINRNSTTYQADLATRITASVKSRFGQSVSSRTNFVLSKHISVQELTMLIDPTGWNLTFKSVEELKSKFAQWISAPHNVGVNSLSDADTRLIDATRAIRNVIAHGSSGSKQIMNDQLSTIATGPACVNSALPRGPHNIHDVGAYLKSFAGEKRRVVIFIERLKQIATQL